MYATVNGKLCTFVDSFLQDGYVFYRFQFEDNPTRIVSLKASHPDIVVNSDDVIPNPVKQVLRNGRRAERLTVSQALCLAYNCLDEDGRARLQALFLGHLQGDDTT